MKDNGADVKWIITFMKTYGEINEDFLISVQQTKDGGYILAGSTESFGSGWLIKTDRKGNEVWSKTYGGNDYDIFRTLQQTKDCGYILAGCTDCSVARNSDVWVIKTDEKGNEVWSKIYGGNDYDMIYSVQQTKDGGYILAGHTQSNGIGGEGWIIKVDKNGNEQWSKDFGVNDEYYEIFSAQQTKDGGYIMAGRAELETYNSEIFYGWLLKVDSNGNEQWSKTFGDNVGNTINSVQQTKDGGYTSWKYKILGFGKI